MIPDKEQIDFMSFLIAEGYHIWLAIIFLITLGLFTYIRLYTKFKILFQIAIVFTGAVAIGILYLAVFNEYMVAVTFI